MPFFTANELIGWKLYVLAKNFNDTTFEELRFE